MHEFKKYVSCNLHKSEMAWHGSTTEMTQHLKRRHVGVIRDEEGGSTKAESYLRIRPYQTLSPGLPVIPPSGSSVVMDVTQYIL